jgi:hypothetical protein
MSFRFKERKNWGRGQKYAQLWSSSRQRVAWNWRVLEKLLSLSSLEGRKMVRIRKSLLSGGEVCPVEALLFLSLGAVSVLHHKDVINQSCPS